MAREEIRRQRGKSTHTRIHSRGTKDGRGGAVGGKTAISYYKAREKIRSPWRHEKGTPKRGEENAQARPKINENENKKNQMDPENPARKSESAQRGHGNGGGVEKG